MVKDFSELFVYRAAYDSAMRIFVLSRDWPREERYALTDQIRRSSRSVCANIAEAWSKRRYQAHFVKTLSDSEAEAAETINWLWFARDCEYLIVDTCSDLESRYRSIRSGLIKMMKESDRWCGPSTLREPGVDYNYGI